MREKLNSNPVAQAAVIGVLLLATGFFVLSTMGGGEEEGEATSSEVSATVNGVAGSGETPGAAVESAIGSLEAGAAAPAPVSPAAVPVSPPPDRVVAAYEAGGTVVLLFVDDGGIDDRLVTSSTRRLAALPGVRTFVVPAAKISRYAAITEGVGVERVPALVVVRPKRTAEAVPTASVSYGFQSPQSVVQAVVDAGYEGPTIDYHP